MRREQTRGREQGFSLIELLTVVAIIALLLAIAIPGLMDYLRQYHIRGATDQLMGEMQTARLTAVKKNVNWGVVFYIASDTTYRYVIEDGQVTAADAVAAGVPANVGQQLTVAQALAAGDAQAGALRTLPQGIVFGGAKCGIAGTGDAVRFSRLGMPAAAVVTGGADRLAISAGRMQLCLEDTARNVARCVTMTSGGRLRSQTAPCS